MSQVSFRTSYDFYITIHMSENPVFFKRYEAGKESLWNKALLAEAGLIALDQLNAKSWKKVGSNALTKRKYLVCFLSDPIGLDFNWG